MTYRRYPNPKYMIRLYNIVQSLETRRVYLIASVLLCVSISICIFINHLILGVSLQNWPGSPGYGIIGQHIAELGFYTADGVELTARRPPLYPYFLSAFHWAFGQQGTLVAYLTQALIYVATGLLLVRFCLIKFRNPAMALLTCSLYCLHFYLVVESLWQRETILFSLILTALLFPIASAPSWHSALSWGFFAGLFYLTRPTGVILPIVLLIGLLSYLKDYSFTKVLRHFIICLSVFTLVTLPWNLYVIQNFDGHQSLPTTSGPENLYKGHIDDFENIFPQVDLDLYNPWMNIGTEDMSEVERSRHIKAEGWSMLLDDIPQAMKRSFIKVFALYSPLRTPFGEGKLAEGENGVYINEFKLYSIQVLMVPHLLLIIFVGPILLLKSWRHLPKDHQRFFLQIGALLLLLTALHAVTFGESRHRLPFDLCFMIATAYSIFRSLEMKARQIQSTDS